MPVTVASLRDNRSLGLVLHTRRAPVDRPVSWVHVSELADPAPFLEGGELLLSTGLPLVRGGHDRGAGPAGDRGADPAAYVHRLADAGVVGLGLGTGLGLPEVPAELVAAADARGLAVLEVPRRTPFIAISRAVSAALAAEEYAAVARASAVQQELTRAAATAGAARAVVDRLARHLGGWALLVDAAGTPLEAAPRDARRRAADLAPAVERLRGVRPPAGAALTDPGETVLLQSLGTGPRSRGFLAVGRPDRFPAADRHVVDAAALLLTLRLEQSRALEGATAALRAALLRLLLAGGQDDVAPVLAALGERLPAAPVRAHVVLGGPEQRAAAVDVAADAAAHAGSPVFAAESDGALVLLTGSGAEPAGRLSDLPGRVPGAVLGIAPPAPWAGLAEAVRQARQAAEHGRATGRPVTAFADLAGRGLAALLDPGATAAFAGAVLAPLVAADRAGPGDLVESLRAWLAAHGQWEPAAAALGVHRHTLRKRIRRAEQLLGRDLGSPGVRAELWLALHPPGGRAG
ncbi:PucR family transcriptional regulator [Geodermatophilus marinus]|uniref:PucR family transcriptional regulator n=1 Tax=Geodermatophilus sp. LHW52908 TaxID=2303986 RepID=UPI000E3BEDF4|nr:PucR family transcriptional regulator [Geodermatophilus sp. LHW52908]RFU22049.1 PucR family transcriptional regulator [Geodermatophilus sp. LHW52908]